MVLFTMVSGQTESSTKEDANILKGKPMKESGKMASLLVLELKLGQMGENMMEYGEWENQLVKARNYILTAE